MEDTKKKTPQVSIGMPVYNGEPFIREALDSLLAQTFTDFELTISDNASTDGTEAICREYAAKDARIRYVRQTENRGAAANFQFVLDEAVGEYFMWAAADDVWAESFLQKTIYSLQSNQTSSFAMCRYKGVSRFHSFFNRTFSDILACIEIEDSYERVYSFTRLPFKTHKDNLVYAMWRRLFVAKVIDDNGIRGGFTELALLRSKGSYISELLFYKYYRKSVPGHWTDPYLSPIIKLLNKLRGRQSVSSSNQGAHDFLHDLELTMRSNCDDANVVSKVLSLNRSHLRVK